ncbi:hypothetical protein G9C98_000943 [Cotesia typhae]|uniref:Uncharacterized protein n=1 Tax=Cotesia typhae TaxID=2053667 RepID=A0A8J5R4H9_9HYME|nr:hypothetical protein G9C98_000943 [Cotesia typhae]
MVSSNQHTMPKIQLPFSCLYRWFILRSRINNNILCYKSNPFIFYIWSINWNRRWFINNSWNNNSFTIF